MFSFIHWIPSTITQYYYPSTQDTVTQYTYPLKGMDLWKHGKMVLVWEQDTSYAPTDIQHYSGGCTY